MYNPVRLHAWLLGGTALLLVGAAWVPLGQSPGIDSIVGRVTLTTRVRGTPLASSAYPTRSIQPHEVQAAPHFRPNPPSAIASRRLTFHASFFARKAFTTTDWDQQGGVAVVWAHRRW